MKPRRVKNRTGGPTQPKPAGACAGVVRMRRGIFSMELVLTLPILFLVLMAVFEFSMLFLARGTVVEASRAAARKASLPGVDLEDVRREARKILSPRLRRAVRVDWDPGTHSGDVVTVVVRVPMRQVAPDLLWPIGYGLAGRDLYAETRMIKE